LDRAFDVIFVVAGEVHDIRSSWFSLRAKTFFGCSMISLKFTVNQTSSAGISGC